MLHGKNKLNHITLSSDDDLICFDIIAFHQCPGQYNGINCGLFCIAVVLHLLDFKTVTEDNFNFNFNHCILLRSKLAAHFNRKNDDANEQTSQVVRDCFPELKGTTILSSYGVEVVGTVPAAAKTNDDDDDDDVILVSREDAEMDDVTTKEAKMPRTRNLPDDDSSTNGDSKPSARPKPTAAATDATIDSRGCVSSLTTNSKNEDISFQGIMRQQNIVEFPTLDDVSPVIEVWEKKSGNWLAIRRSLVVEYCLYLCKEHVNCTFQIYIGRRRLNVPML